MTHTPSSTTAKSYLPGIVTVLFSAAIFAIPLLTATKRGDTFGLFALNYLLSVSFLIGTSIKKVRKENIFPILVLFLISAYSLNRDMNVFENSTPWLAVALVILCVNYMSLQFIDRVGKPIQHTMGVLLGVGLAMFTYLAIYLIPIYPISVPGLIVFGISIHSFVPACFVFFTARKAMRLYKADRKYLWSISGGVVASLLAVGVFAFQWVGIHNDVNKNFRKSLIADNTDLPGWVRVAASLPTGIIADKYLKGSLVYTTPSGSSGDFFSWGRGAMRNLEETRLHDPLVMCASFFVSPPELSEDERIKVLESMSASGHRTEERFWSGTNLHTSNVISNVRIWPKQRIAYTEKTVTVSNDGSVNGWWDREEGIYTFHLPEGGVVTSLSLWINGKEEKGILTSKGKADSAYRTVVGVESRDPSVVHWQEGNTVSVRVFPVESRQSRIFKIGVTAPLTAANNKLLYENIWFEGPNVSGAGEIRQIDWVTVPKDLNMPGDFKQNGTNRYIREAKYQQDWRFEFDDPGFSEDRFSFNGNLYTLKQYIPERMPSRISKVYLDINSAWTKGELETVYEQVKDKDVYIFKEAIVRLTPDNMKQGIADELLENRFSLFPFYEIEDTAATLVITKSPQFSPSVKSLSGSDFLQKLEGKVKTGSLFKVFNIGYGLTPYMRTLKEHRVFDFEQGDVALLKELLQKNVFAKNNETDDHVVVDNARLAIVRSKDSARQDGADHIMRLFAYNHLMSKLKGRISGVDVETALVEEAQEANIVTPVSSLVVLETQKDYDRFDISKSKNSLDNATLKSKGAVPEPHEWMLIILCAVVTGWLLFRQKITLLLKK